MAKRVLSIDISRTLIKACEIDYKVSKRNPVVHQVFTVATPEGQFDDGFITNTDSFGDYLKQKIAENNQDKECYLHDHIVEGGKQRGPDTRS